MDIEQLPEAFIDYIRDIQASKNHEAHCFRLAKALNCRVRVGLANYSQPRANPPTIVLQPWYFGTNNDVMRHELAHVLATWSGIERWVLEEYGLEEGLPIVERLCDQAIAFLTIPQPYVDRAVRRHGVSALAVQELRRELGCSHEVALRRLIHDHPRAMRAGFVLTGEYVTQVETCNLSLPFWHLSRVRGVQHHFRDVHLSLAPLTLTTQLGVVRL